MGIQGCASGSGLFEDGMGAFLNDLLLHLGTTTGALSPVYSGLDGGGDPGLCQWFWAV